MYFCSAEKYARCFLGEGSPNGLRKQARHCMDRSKDAFGRGVHEALAELGSMLIDEAHASETCWMAQTRGLLAMAFIAFGSTASIAGNAEEPAAVARDYRSVQPRDQHYYPTTGVKPKIGRAEDLLAPTSAPQPAEPYQRRY
jgi:hypothetical protein